MREGWTYRKLGGIASFINGYPFKPSEWGAAGRPIIRIQNLNNSDAPFNYYDGSISDKFVIRRGDVLISWSGTLGVYEWQEANEALLNQHIFKVVFDKQPINKSFFKYAVTSRINEMKGKVHGITMQHITKGEFDNTSIPVPPLPEQERIVAELDLLQGIIDKQKAQLKELDTLAQSIFYDMFGDPVENERRWQSKPLKELSTLIINGTTPKGGAEVYVPEGIVFFRSQNVWRNRIDYDDVAHIDKATDAKMKKSSLHHNDILITKTGRINTENSSLGRAALYEGATGEANINGHVYLIRLKTGIVSHQFVLKILTSVAYRDYIRKVCVGGIDKRQINKEHVEEFPIILPPVSLQQAFATKIEAIERQKASIYASIDDTQKLFDYTMDKYFG